MGYERLDHGQGPRICQKDERERPRVGRAVTADCAGRRRPAMGQHEEGDWHAARRKAREAEHRW